jgi:VanZ family protein
VINYRFDRITSGSIANTAGDRWLLKVPDRLVPLKREFLAISAANDFHKRWFYGDALVNFLGFIPLGFFLGFTLRAARSWTRLKIIAVTAGSGFWLSLLIELNQGFLITRSSSLTDLVLNSLGTLAGTCLLLNLPARHLPGKTA